MRTAYRSMVRVRPGDGRSARESGQGRQVCGMPCSPAVRRSNGHTVAGSMRRTARSNAFRRPSGGAEGSPQGQRESAQSLAACSPELESAGGSSDGAENSATSASRRVGSPAAEACRAFRMPSVRSTTDQDHAVFVDTLHAAFGRFPETPAEDGGGVWWAALERERCLLARAADGRPVGTAGTYAFELTLPGGSLAPAAGVTAVGVVPSHRRQGVLSAMMRHQLTELRAGGEFLSVLLASEAAIYGRFGYGPATYTRRLTVRRHQAAFAPLRVSAADGAPAEGARAGSVEVLRRAECGEILEGVYDRYRRAQPGALSRPPRWWAMGAGQPPVSRAPRYVAVHRDADGVPDGYASYSIGEPDTLTVDETIATDDAAFTALARFLLGHDLVAQVVFKHLPPEHALRWQLADFRAGTLSGETDWLHRPE